MRNQQLFEHLQSSFSFFHITSPERFKQIAEFVLALSEPYKNAALHALAESMVSSMGIHLLDLCTIFQKNATREDILPDECRETLAHVLPEMPGILEEVKQNIQIRSLEDLVILSNITGSLQALSTTSSAEEAQGWLYELPALYQRQLKRESLFLID